jgi:glycosyltransferase involved in cell wall biosynthesis
MLFSVVVPTYNRLELLRRTLESVRRQQFTDFELIVVDDGSTDGTLADLRAMDAGVQVLTQPNRGPGAARNRGLACARGRYVAFLDSDDLWFPWTLASYAALIRRHDSPAFIAGKALPFEHEAALAQAVDAAPVADWFSDYYASGTEWRWWGVSSFVVRTDLLRGCGGFVDADINGEDGDLALRLGEAAGFVQVRAPFTFGYRQHAGNIAGDLPRLLAGAWHKIKSEHTGRYPGGARRRAERWRILARHIRPLSLACLRAGRFADGARLYGASFGWHLRLGRWKYLAGFPLSAAGAMVRRRRVR